MTKRVGIVLLLGCAACGLDDFGTFDDDAGVDARSTGTSTPVDGSPSSSGALEDGQSPPAEAAAADAGDDQVDAARDADGAAPLDAGADVAELVDAADAAVCVAPPLHWTWQCDGTTGIGVGSMCVRPHGSSSVLGESMPYDCRQCMSNYSCACVLAHFGEQNACGTQSVDGGLVTIAPASCTDVPDGGQLVVCP